MSLEAKRLRDKIASKLGISKSAVWEIAVRRLAEMEGVGADREEGTGEKADRETEEKSHGLG